MKIEELDSYPCLDPPYPGVAMLHLKIIMETKISYLSLETLFDACLMMKTTMDLYYAGERECLHL